MRIPILLLFPGRVLGIVDFPTTFLLLLILLGADLAQLVPADRPIGSTCPKAARARTWPLAVTGAGGLAMIARDADPWAISRAAYNLTDTLPGPKVGDLQALGLVSAGR